MGNTCSVCNGTYSSPYILLTNGAVCRYCQDAANRSTGTGMELYRPPKQRRTLPKGCAVIAFMVLALPMVAATALTFIG